MSHKAVNWALEQRHLKAAPWVVLIQLADRHNRDTLRVDPEQVTLAVDCNMSRSTINVHLGSLEELGLLVRVPRENPATKKRLSTFYILGLDFENPPHVDYAVSDFRTRIEEVKNGNKDESHVRNSDLAPMSEKTAIPCPEKRQSHVRNPDTNHGIEPVKEPCVSPEAPHTHDFELVFEKFFEAYPRIGNQDETLSALKSALDAGADPDHIIVGAKSYAEEQKGNARQYIAYSQNWLKDRRWEAFERKSAPVGDVDKNPKASMASAIKSGMHALCQRISVSQAIDLIREGLVTIDEARKVDLVTLNDCRRAGVLK